MTRFLTVHGHFYQPPRENPWTGEVGVESSAAPYANWNERITDECYRPNARPVSVPGVEGGGAPARLLPPNYSRMSFNFGPTLLSWLDRHAPDVVEAIVLAEKDGRERYAGHGPAIAQAYNHVILPLANVRDRRTQAWWGLRDFERRFGRSPEGMWLPETAVDIPTLETLASLGIRFTILAPNQAARVRALGSSDWLDASGGRIDPRRAYETRLPSGRSIALFFYDGPASNAIAFGTLSEGGVALARRLASLAMDSPEPQLLHVATDGETYGHHHRGGVAALAEAFDAIERSGFARVTSYGEFLSIAPPRHEVEIFESTAWSCAHGLGRWSADCGCRIADRPGWAQKWRGPLREALDRLRDSLAEVYEERGGALLADPWAARDGWIEVVLDPSASSFDGFVRRHAARPLGAEEREDARRLLEMERYAMLMYTSCGWFFDDPSGLETTQILRYAARAVELAPPSMRGPIESEFLLALERAPSNDPAAGDARRIYEANAPRRRPTGPVRQVTGDR